MNYINQLEKDKTELTEKLLAAQKRVVAMMVHLNGDKFTGFDSDGHRKDWVSTGDMQTFLRELRSELLI